MYRIRSASGAESVYNSLEEFSVAAQRGEVRPEDQIFHMRANRWLDVRSHPHYRTAMGGSEPRPAAPESPASPPAPEAKNRVQVFERPVVKPAGQTVARPQLQASPKAETPNPETPAPPAPPPRPAKIPKSKELTFVDVGAIPGTLPPNAVSPKLKLKPEPEDEANEPPVKPASAPDTEFLIMADGIDSPVRTSTGYKTITEDMRALIEAPLPDPVEDLKGNTKDQDGSDGPRAVGPEPVTAIATVRRKLLRPARPEPKPAPAPEAPRQTPEAAAPAVSPVVRSDPPKAVTPAPATRSEPSSLAPAASPAVVQPEPPKLVVAAPEAPMVEAPAPPAPMPEPPKVVALPEPPKAVTPPEPPKAAAPPAPVEAAAAPVAPEPVALAPLAVEIVPAAVTAPAPVAEPASVEPEATRGLPDASVLQAPPVPEVKPAVTFSGGGEVPDSSSSSRTLMIGGGVAVLALAAVLLVWRPWKSAPTTEVAAAQAAPTETVPAGAEPAAASTDPQAPSSNAPSTLPPAAAPALSRPADAGTDSPGEVIAATKPNFRPVIAMPTGAISVDPGIGTSGSAASPSELAGRLATAQKQAQQELDGRLAGAGFRNVLAPSRLSNASGLEAARSSWTAGGDAIRLYRARIARLEKAYEDSMLTSQRAQRWSGDELRAWAGRQSLAEPAEATQLADLMFSQVGEGLEILATLDGQYSIKGTTITIKNASTASRYTSIRSWVEQRMSTWAATPESARSTTVNAIMRALGDGFPAAH